MEVIARLLGGGFVGLLVVCLMPLFAGLWIYDLLYGAALKLWWWRKHGQHGRTFLVVYSDSLKWSDIVPERILPLLGSRAVVVNISKDPLWKASRSVERRVHKHWAGKVEHTPIVVRLSRFGKVVEVRLFDALMLNAKKGDPSELENKVKALRALAQSSAA
jgi:hypothetical protein